MTITVATDPLTGTATYTGRHRNDTPPRGFGTAFAVGRHALRPDHFESCPCNRCTANRRRASLGGAR